MKRLISIMNSVSTRKPLNKRQKRDDPKKVSSHDRQHQTSMTKLLVELSEIITDIASLPDVMIDKRSKEVQTILFEISRGCNVTYSKNWKDNVEIVRKQRGQQQIVQIMKRYLAIENSPFCCIQFVACRALTSSICSLSNPWRDDVLRATDSDAVVIGVLRQYPEDLVVQMSGCQYLAVTVNSLMNSFNSIDSSIDSPNTVSSNCSRTISLDDSARKNRFASGLRAILSALKKFHENLELQRIGMVYFLNISHYGNQIAMLDHREIIDHKGQGFSSVCDDTCVLSPTTDSSHDCPSYFTSVLHAITRSMMAFTSSRSLYLCGCIALSNFYRSITNDDVVSSRKRDDIFANVSVSSTVAGSLKAFPNDDRVQRAGKYFLSETKPAQLSQNKNPLSRKCM